MSSLAPYANNYPNLTSPEVLEARTALGYYQFAGTDLELLFRSPRVVDLTDAQQNLLLFDELDKPSLEEFYVGIAEGIFLDSFKIYGYKNTDNIFETDESLARRRQMFSQALPVLAQTYSVIGRPDRAIALLESARSLGVDFDEATSPEIPDADYPKVLERITTLTSGYNYTAPEWRERLIREEDGHVFTDPYDVLELIKMYYSSPDDSFLATLLVCEDAIRLHYQDSQSSRVIVAS
jgi:hypothetical protein